MKKTPMCCGQPIVGVRTSGVDHYEAKQYYCRCNKCRKSTGVRSTIGGAVQVWKEKYDD